MNNDDHSELRTPCSPIVHTMSLLSVSTEAEAYEVFRATCAVTAPTWTQGEKDPATWHAPPDAAGGLILWDETGKLVRVEPPTEKAEYAKYAAEYALDDLRAAGGALGIVRAMYASCGGRVVALCQTTDGWWITVSRSHLPIRRGATEEALLAADPAARCELQRRKEEPVMNKMTLVNLTPHAIVLRDPTGTEHFISPSGEVARVTSTPGVCTDELIGYGCVPVYSAPAWGEVEGLPDQKAGTIYIVSALVAARVPERMDVVCPGTGPNDGAIRDAAGRVVAVTRLVSAAAEIRDECIHCGADNGTVTLETGRGINRQGWDCYLCGCN